MDYCCMRRGWPESEPRACPRPPTTGLCAETRRCSVLSTATRTHKHVAGHITLSYLLIGLSNPELFQTNAKVVLKVI